MGGCGIVGPLSHVLTDPDTKNILFVVLIAPTRSAPRIRSKSPLAR